MARIPPEAGGRRRSRAACRTWRASCKAKIFGQDAAVERVAQAIKMNRAGLGSPQRPIGCFLFAGPTGRRQDRAGQAAGRDPGRRVPALRHVGVHGAAHGLAPDRRAARLRRLRPGRAADRRHPPDAARGAAAGRDREGAPGSVQPAAAGHGPRLADRQQRAQVRLPPRRADHDQQRRGARSVAASARVRPGQPGRIGWATPTRLTSACSRPSSATGWTPRSTSRRWIRR